ncbi:SGNH/GDSL hydrolase family protein [Rhodococcus sp. G-MC3]|uniref:SGNH/GDSL hydrolase family protein n=1 Tax=Rhodococcus sp. G-MC3 TaxID=3046209 RepID=UPI0024B97912|nr:SGNH/GDSL hydrolase family protein [Rhodococcus sp. G-MC3]MDJ0394160.1 SGNH/GDSL hydrolase family protein [Rhodococcus sp. G-MC3]
MTIEWNGLSDFPVATEFFAGALHITSTADGMQPMRLPQWALDQVDDSRLTMAATQPSGVRLVLRTTATVVEVDVLPTRVIYPGTPPRPVGIFDLLVDGAPVSQTSADRSNTVSIDIATGATTRTAGQPSTLRFDGLPDRDKTVELWLPHNEMVCVVAIRADAPVTPGRPEPRRSWLHYGSSISQGSNASSPSATWAALASRTAGVELTNLGFSGSALLDPCIARVLRNSPADFISVKIGINLVNTDVMRLRAFGPAVHGFLDTVRDGHPETPLLVISPLYCPIHEDTPGPGAFDIDALRSGTVRFVATGDATELEAGRLTLRSIRAELKKIVEQRKVRDAALHYLDGLDLYGQADFADFPLPDALHPDENGHRRIAEHFTSIVFAGDGPFGVANTR